MIRLGRGVTALLCAAACATGSVPAPSVVSSTAAASTAATTTTTMTTTVPPPTRQVKGPAADDSFPRFDMSGGRSGTDFGMVVREYSRLIRWIYLHPERLGEAEIHFMPEGPAYEYLRQVTAEFVARGWRVDLGEWELLEEPTLVAGGDPEGIIAGLFASYTKRAASPILSADTAETVDFLPAFDRQTFQMALRHIDGSWKVFRDDNTLVG